MSEHVFERRDDSGDFAIKLSRALERRAAEVNVSREEYIDGMVSGKYPPITSRDVEDAEE